VPLEVNRGKVLGLGKGIHDFDTQGSLVSRGVAPAREDDWEKRRFRIGDFRDKEKKKKNSNGG